jgi:PadR family transcriptional regulator, regulatory protein PadR
MPHNLKRLTEFFVLTTIPTEPMYAKQIIERLNYASIKIQKGTLYPILNSLKRAQILHTSIEESDVGPVRKYYYLTPKGRTRLEELNSDWKKLNETVHKLRRSPSLDR